MTMHGAVKHVLPKQLRPDLVANVSTAYIVMAQTLMEYGIFFSTSMECLRYQDKMQGVLARCTTWLVDMHSMSRQEETPRAAKFFFVARASKKQDP